MPLISVLFLLFGFIRISYSQKCLEMSIPEENGVWAYHQKDLVYCGLGCRNGWESWSTQNISGEKIYVKDSVQTIKSGIGVAPEIDTAVTIREYGIQEETPFNRVCLSPTDSIYSDNDSIYFASKPHEFVFSKKLGLLSHDSESFISSHGNGMVKFIHLLTYNGSDAVIKKKLELVKTATSINATYKAGFKKNVRRVELNRGYLFSERTFNILGVPTF